MNRTNCWEYMKCGRQPGGPRAMELGVCPVTTTQELNGAHGGLNAGRACWIVAGSLCHGKVQGSFAQKLHECWRCSFFNNVKAAESETPNGFTATRLGIERSLQRH